MKNATFEGQLIYKFDPDQKRFDQVDDFPVKYQYLTQGSRSDLGLEGHYHATHNFATNEDTGRFIVFGNSAPCRDGNYRWSVGGSGKVYKYSNEIFYVGGFSFL